MIRQQSTHCFCNKQALFPKCEGDPLLDYQMRHWPPNVIGNKFGIGPQILLSKREVLAPFKGSSSHLGNSACLMLSDILLKEMQGRCFSSFQEDDGDGKVPVSALTRRDGHWPGGNNRSSAHGRSVLYTALRPLSSVWMPLRACPLSISANGSRRSMRGSPS